MPTDEQTSAAATATAAATQETIDAGTPATTADTPADTSENLSTEALLEKERSEKILKAKELYSHGSRNFLVKSYAEAADELSQVCALYEELHGELSDELGMPYLLYGKSLVALALDENKVIDVPDEEEDDDEDEDNEEAKGEVSTNGDKTVETNGSTKLEAIKEDGVDSTAEVSSEKPEEAKKSDATPMETEEKIPEESQVSSTEDDKSTADETKPASSGKANGCSNGSPVINDGEKPSTSNGEAGEDAAAEDLEDNEAASNLQLAWEILELAAKIFDRQGERGRSNLAEVQTELGNIEFENNLLEAARIDYEKALSIYETLPTNYRRAMAEIHYKIGLSYLMQQLNKEGAASLKEACKLIADEIEEIKAKEESTDKDKNNIQDMEETKQEIEAKINEIEETQAQNVAEVRAALDSYIKPLNNGDVDAGTSKSAITTTAADASSSASVGNGSTSAITSSSKPTDISHLIKRKKPEDGTSEAEAVACSPAKRPAV